MAVSRCSVRKSTQFTFHPITICYTVLNASVEGILYYFTFPFSSVQCFHTNSICVTFSLLTNTEIIIYLKQIILGIFFTLISKLANFLYKLVRNYQNLT